MVGETARPESWLPHAMARQFRLARWLVATIGGSGLACVPFGVYALWVLSRPGVRDAIDGLDH
jgi:hypothetical protein